MGAKGELDAIHAADAEQAVALVGHLAATRKLREAEAAAAAPAPAPTAAPGSDVSTPRTSVSGASSAMSQRRMGDIAERLHRASIEGRLPGGRRSTTRRTRKGRISGIGAVGGALGASMSMPTISPVRRPSGQSNASSHAGSSG